MTYNMSYIRTLAISSLLVLGLAACDSALVDSDDASSVATIESDAVSSSARRGVPLDTVIFIGNRMEGLSNPHELDETSDWSSSSARRGVPLDSIILYVNPGSIDHGDGLGPMSSTQRRVAPIDSTWSGDLGI